MKMRALGEGTLVSAIGLGATPITVETRPDESVGVRVIHAVLDAGVSWIDTADAYCRDDDDAGYGERIVARAIKEWTANTHDVRVATKGGYRRPGGAWTLDARPRSLKAACEASLSSLGVDSIFLYQLHAPDPNVPLVESVGAIADLRREGKVQNVGLCNVDAAQILDARKVVRIASVQNFCHLGCRTSFDDGIVDLCRREGIAFIAHSPLGGHFHRGLGTEHPALRAVGARRGLTPHQVALAWLLGASPIILAIPGARRVESAVSSALAGDAELTEEDRAELMRAFPSPPAIVRKLKRVRRRALGFVRGLRARYTWSSAPAA
jgi:aryl-alcohol dehydrogenase-like predicted oxidoreductase